MKLIFETQQAKSNNLRYISYTIIALLLSVVHIVFLDFISVGGITPDFLLILVIWIAIYEGQFTGIFFGFGIGLLFDIVSADVIGINALTKTVAAFVAGWFYEEGKADRKVGGFVFLIIVFICSVLHNLIYYFFYIKLSDISFMSFFLKYGLATSLYTTVFAVFAMLIRGTGSRN